MDASVSPDRCANGNFVNVINLWAETCSKHIFLFVFHLLDNTKSFLYVSLYREFYIRDSMVILGSVVVEIVA